MDVRGREIHGLGISPRICVSTRPYKMTVLDYLKVVYYHLANIVGICSPKLSMNIYKRTLISAHSHQQTVRLCLVLGVPSWTIQTKTKMWIGVQLPLKQEP